MEAGEKVKGETTKSGFRGNMFDSLMQGWKSSSKIGFAGRGG